MTKSKSSEGDDKVVVARSTMSAEEVLWLLEQPDVTTSPLRPRGLSASDEAAEASVRRQEGNDNNSG